MLAVVFTTACSEEFLDRPPEDAYVVDNFYQTDEHLTIATKGLYGAPWFAWNDKATFAIGDGAGGIYATNDGALNQFALFSVTSSNSRLNEGWRSLYTVISHANFIIRAIENSPEENFTPELKAKALGEARFMRGYAYFYLAMLWGDVPIIADNVAIIEDALIAKNPVADAYEFARRDLVFASENLLLADEPGRVTQWSAKAVLARLHLNRAGLGQSGSRNTDDLAMAREYAEDVILNSGLMMLDNYGDLFVIANNNNEESLFALQWIDKGGTWGVQNTHQAYFSPEGSIAGVGDGWGGGSGAYPNIRNLYETGDERRKATFMFPGDEYPQLKSTDGGYLYEAESPWASAIKKYVVGSAEDNPGQLISFMSTPMNTYMMRLSEVYLIAAEAILGDAASTTDATALEYYNAVRERAGLSARTEVTWMDIFNEKKLELAMEGHHWFDVVRWHYFAPEDARNYINSQDRGRYSWEDGNPILESSFASIDHSDFILPYPEGDVTMNPLLMEDAVPYEFND
ncbi:putative outer membrane starch-binding protein [Marinoscillum furvescens DSM 4134]|uniref:Putative outer membrane starch-binding protein n=2 Tax=Marinoscillum furvescens TaxID=1026 RepID=A0A3D9KY86_MARFU|nr:putative outer membrane starch-binding protein [Marinoscillum furvescens DSM 4134]